MKPGDPSKTSTSELIMSLVDLMTNPDVYRYGTVESNRKIADAIRAEIDRRIPIPG